VYTALNGTGFNVVGGRNPAVGVGGFTLGGGKHLVLLVERILTSMLVRVFLED
jgi:hypothetical protein